uniref:Uncharacterized protein n=1 Tax=Meloidogyne javanica TaxID=6303 RepID=A0A915MLL3_MELJA
MFDFLKSNKDEKIQQQKEIIEAHEETIKKLNEKIKILEEDKQKQLDLVTEQHVKEINDFRASLDTLEIQLTQYKDQLQSKDMEIQQLMETNGEQINNLNDALNNAWLKVEGCENDLRKRIGVGQQ